MGMESKKSTFQMLFNDMQQVKLKNEHDLFRIRTLGFRGEALPSIASVSKLEIITSTGDEGTKYRT